jgi:hypothetical protein
MPGAYDTADACNRAGLWRRGPRRNLQRDSSAGRIRFQIDFVVDPQTLITTRG